MREKGVIRTKSDVSLTPRAAALTETQARDVFRAYVERRLVPRNQRGKTWTPPHGMSPTDVYELLHAWGYSDLVGGPRVQFLERLAHHPELDTRGELVEYVPQPTVSSGFTLDSALLESLIRAEVHRVVTSLRGEIEHHVRKETQAAVQRESERAANTLLHSMASTFNAAVAEEVARQLEEFTR